MIKLLSVFVLASFFSTFSYCQKVIVKVTMDNRMADAKNDTIFYSEKRSLTWDDFKGVPDYNNPGGATTASGFAFDANMNMVGNAVSLNLNVFTFFSKKNSWKKPGIHSAYHLLHEQHHFDITRICAQKFYTDLLKADFTMSNYNKLLTSIFNADFNENNIRQQKYDDETRHSIDSTAQFRWNDKIANEIKGIGQ